MAKAPDLSDQVVLVTGGCRGLGLAIAKAFYTHGARVLINYHSSTSLDVVVALENIKASWGSGERHPAGEGGGVDALCADVTNADEVKAMFDAIEKHAEFHGRPVTTVVNNAMAGKFRFNGEGRPKLHELDWAQMDRQLQGFLRGTLNTTQAAVPHFERAGFGRIINIGTNLLSNPVVPYHDYVAGKGALLAFTRTSAAELGEKNITVNMVSGGLLRTTEASACTPDAVFDIIQNTTPLKRVTTPEEVADVVLFFASPWARAVTGQEMNVDGGLVMR